MPSPDARQIAMLVNTGSKRRREGRFADALALYGQAIALDPKFAPSYFNRGMVHYSMHNAAAMQEDFDRAESLAPDHAEMLQKMGIPYVHLKQYDRAIAVLKKATALKPGMEDAWLWLCRAHYDLGDDDAAYATLRAGFSHCPDSAPLKIAYRLFLSRMPDSREAIARERERFMTNLSQMMHENLSLAEPETQLQFLPSAAAYHGLNEKELRRRFAEFMLKLCPSLAWTAPHCAPGAARRPGPIRLGFVSEGVHLDTTSQFIDGILKGLKADGDFEILLLTNSPPHLLDAARMSSIAHHCIPFGPVLAEARQTIAQAQPDILFYLEVGLHHLSYFLPFARLAPIQCSWGGLPLTTGIPNMDYFVTTRGAESETCQEHYTETPLFFEGNVAVFERPKPDGNPKPKESYGLAGGEARNYLCPALLHKMHPDMDDVFAGILSRDPLARICLFRSPQPMLQQNVEARLARHVAPEHMPRVLFLPFLPKQDFLHALTLADVVVDCMHYAFGTTAYLAFGVNVPFVTHRGEFLRGRGAGACMYDRMGMPEMIAASKEELIALALRMGQDAAFRDRQKARLRECSDVLFNDTHVVTQLAERFKTLVKTARAA